MTKPPRGRPGKSSQAAGLPALSGIWALVPLSAKSGGLDPNGVFLRCFPRLLPNGGGRTLFYLKRWGLSPKQLS